MNKEKHKICSHCEGRISVEADTCLYCGMPLFSTPVNSSYQEELPPLYPPSYSQTGADYMKTESDFVTRFKPASQPEDSLGGISLPQSAAAALETESEDKSGFIALFLVLLGSNLLILGLMQALFSEGGVLRLEWNANYWFIFCFLAGPLLYFGIKKSRES